MKGKERERKMGKERERERESVGKLFSYLLRPSAGNKDESRQKKGCGKAKIWPEKCKRKMEIDGRKAGEKGREM